MGNSTATASLFAPEQFKVTSLQVYNWGTFSALHTIPIAAEGFLFVGRSGSGKSTLLDAFSALLTPPRWVDFNAAAREADRSGRDRNLISYIRGAWAEQKDGSSGEIATRYLRSGTTWSALALSYRGDDDHIVVLVQVMWLRGNASGTSDVKRHFLIFERPFDLRELEEFGRANLDVRKLKQLFPAAFITREFKPYCERFRHLLGIDSEIALRLLHKTQSAKNLGDLNTFLREFMLDKPETFRVAERLVDEFDELNAAHQAVVTARQQVETLVPARERYQQRQQLICQRQTLESLRDGIDNYATNRRISLLKQQLNQLAVEADSLAGSISQQKDKLERHNTTLRELELQHHQAGGQQIETWQRELQALEQQRQERLSRRHRAEDACRQLEQTLPDAPRQFAELVAAARQELEDFADNSAALRAQRDLLVGDKQRKEQLFKQTVAEVQALERQPSNIPARMLELRDTVATAIGIAVDALPFVGELIEVKEDEQPWQGAIERVLHGFALSLLVDERHYAALSSYINDHHLGQRLVYYRTGNTRRHQPGAVSSDSLILKLNIRSGAHADWLNAELRRRFDYVCVESVPAMKRAERAITSQGQIKHSQIRHEKDDRHNVDDRHHWVLGFNNRAKLALYRRQAQQLADEIAALEQQGSTLAARDNKLQQRSRHCQTLVNLQWQEIDVATPLGNIASLQQKIDHALADNSTLHDLAARIDQQRQICSSCDGKLRETTIKYETICKQRDDSEQLLQHLHETTLEPLQQQGLDERFAALQQPLELANLERAVRTVEGAIRDEIDTLRTEINRCENIIEKQFDSFIHTWPAAAEGLDATLAAATDFFAKLARLESDGLPAHEQRFFELLESQSNQNLAALSTYLSDARKEIMERMELVNASLAQVPFNQGSGQTTFLQIEPSDRQLMQVREFRQEIRQALSHAWNDEREQAEERFLVLRRLVERLSSQEAEDKRWRNTVLDVRLHMEFVGREIDAEGVEVEIYRSGSGKSGGQRQKLATTCLAAALRYQLGGNEHGIPVYAPVVLDEAFDKADNEFTALAMNIFANFGFQMIVATPLKSVMTLEPFIGGACFIDIRERTTSSVLLIEYNHEQQRLNLPNQSRMENGHEISR